MQLRNVDFNLLLPLRTLLEERSVSRAAERMHMSQPALSAALARLRRHFNDELLRRSGNSYELTALGVQLLERTVSATRGLERVFSAQAEFDASTSTREFSIFTSDYGMSVLGGTLANVLVEVAPGVRLRFNNMTAAVVNNAPDSLREHDGIFMPHGYFTNQSHLDLFSDRWVCVVAPDNTAVGDSLGFDQLGDLTWVYTFAGRSEYTPAAKQMELFGVDPHVQISTSSFLIIPDLLAGSNRIALLHELSARRLEAAGLVRVLEVPFAVAPIREAFWWNAVHDRDPEHVWLRAMITEAISRAGLSLVD